MSYAVNAVYYIENKSNHLFNPIAIRPCFFQNNQVAWEDTSKGKTVAYFQKFFELLDEAEVRAGQIPSKIYFTFDDQTSMTFIILTKEIFNTNVKNKVCEPIDFISNEDAQKYYLDTSFD